MAIIETNATLPQEYYDKLAQRRRRDAIKRRLQELSEDFVQVLAGETIDDIEARRAEFVTLHNELRVLEGKEPRAVAAVEGGEETV